MRFSGTILCLFTIAAVAQQTRGRPPLSAAITEQQIAAAAQELEKLVKDDPQRLDPHVQLATLYDKLHRAEDGAPGTASG